MTDPTVAALLDELQWNLQIALTALQGAEVEIAAAVIAEREECARIADAAGCKEAASRIRARAGGGN